MAAQDAELDARQMDAQHQEALAENAAREAAAEAPEPEAGPCQRRVPAATTTRAVIRPVSPGSPELSA